jgi:hypothetical protein
MTPRDEILTVAEVAAELRCSKAHVHNAIRGKVAGVSLFPAMHGPPEIDQAKRSRAVEKSE